MAAVVTDNDGRAFISKAEFDSLKNSFQAQLNSYNKGIDNKIAAAITLYLSGLKIQKTEKIDPIYSVYYDSVTSKYNRDVYSVPRGKFNKNKQYKNSYNIYATKYNGRGTWGSTVQSLDPYAYNGNIDAGAWYYAVCNIRSGEITDQLVFVTDEDYPYRVKYKYNNGYLNINGGMFWKQLWIGTQQSWWINTGIFNNIKLESAITSWSVQGFNSNGYNQHEDNSKTISQDTRYDQGTADENDLRSYSGQYGSTGGCGLIITKTETNLDNAIYLFDVVDENIVLYNEKDDTVEEYTESVYSSETMTIREEVKAVNGTNIATMKSSENSYGWYLDTAWPHCRIKQTHSGMSGTTYIRFNNLAEVENGLLTYKKHGENTKSAPGYGGGLPLFTLEKDGDVEINIRIDASLDRPSMSKARIWIYKGEFPNKYISSFTDDEKLNLVKFDSDNYIDIDVGVQTKIVLKGLKEKSTYFLKFGDKDVGYGGQITYLNDFVATYKDS